MLTPSPLVKSLPWQATGQSKIVEFVTLRLLKMSFKIGIFLRGDFFKNSSDLFPGVVTGLAPKFFEEGFNGVDFYHRSYIDTRTKPANQFPHIFGIHIFTPERVRLALLWFSFVNTAPFIR